ncbi:glycerophosphodiester phosphodiesterase family protein [Dysgonomonas sp. BGC7]|uniref:glycerophosphodiester phosphodiesterase family protein n=1 Tax=Dysgonomonas sp. BGC7 TaxID=1658008 RepID=UPI00067FA289|nr:glycerophosphodiester phosphodiesterase family protein [Dysgonomonas sp. BGC7]MBD8390110.1 hypothetical protein [Dysgonomonas sp. BGC7]
MKRTNILLSLILICTFPLFSQSVKQLLVLDNYLIPENKKGAVIGKVISQTNNKVKLIKDTSNLFTIDNKGVLKLKKGATITSNSAYKYEITLKYGNDEKSFELVKDNFIRNGVVAHRGAWKHHDASQNSLKSLKKAIEIGCAGSEFDVWLSSDNAVVLSHDPTIGGKTVEETTASELYSVALKDGDYVPNLEQYINCIKKQNRTRLVLEVKTSQKGTERSEAVADSSVQIVHRLKAQGWTDYITFSFEAALRIRELDPTAQVLYLSNDKKTLEELKAAKISGIDYHYSSFFKDEELANKARKMGLLTNAWTVNKKEDMKKIIGQKLDFITTDEPEILLDLLKE